MITIPTNNTNEHGLGHISSLHFKERQRQHTFMDKELLFTY